MRLTRQQHDKILATNQPLLARLFKLPYKWSIGGVIFYNVPPSLLQLVESFGMTFHKTAIARTQPSRPMRRLATDGLIVGYALDYGCGRGFDADYYDLEKYDPNGFADNDPGDRFDTITCNYVLNVIESDEERLTVLQDIQARLSPNGRAYITVRNDKRALRGKTKTGTWQGEIVLRLPVVYKESGFITYELSRDDELDNSIQSVRTH